MGNEESPRLPDPHQLHERSELRPPLSLGELLELLARAGLLDAQQCADIESRTITLRSQVLKDKVGSVRSQAAARYDVSPAEIVAAAALPHASTPRRRLDEEAIAQAIAEAALYPYEKIDPLKLDNKLITSTFSRAYALRHVVCPIGREGAEIRLAITDPFDSALRESIESNLNAPVAYVVASKKDILSVVERVHGFRSKVDKASQELSAGAQTALVELVELRTNDQLAASSDEHVIAAVDYLLGYAFDQRASDIHLEPRPGSASIRFRIDGILHEIETLPISVPASRSSPAWTSRSGASRRTGASRPSVATGRSSSASPAWRRPSARRW